MFVFEVVTQQRLPYICLFRGRCLAVGVSYRVITYNIRCMLNWYILPCHRPERLKNIAVIIWSAYKVWRTCNSTTVCLHIKQGRCGFPSVIFHGQYHFVVYCSGSHIYSASSSVFNCSKRVKYTYNGKRGLTLKTNTVVSYRVPLLMTHLASVINT
jgi:hypothetical protein